MLKWTLFIYKTLPDCSVRTLIKGDYRSDNKIIINNILSKSNK